MASENIAIIETLFDAFFRRDAEVMNTLMDPEVEWNVQSWAVTASGLPPDLAGTYKGREGTRAFWSGWLSSWKDLKFDYELREGEGDVVVALIRNQRQWGRLSGVETQVPPYAWTYTLRAGKVIRGEFFADQAAAIKAAGLSS